MYAGTPGELIERYDNAQPQLFAGMLMSPIDVVCMVHRDGLWYASRSALHADTSEC
jgi:hypothetical protein